MIRTTVLAAGAALGLMATSAFADPSSEFSSLITECKAGMEKHDARPCMLVRPPKDMSFESYVSYLRQWDPDITTAAIIEASGLEGVVNEAFVLRAGEEYAFFTRG